MGLTLLHHEYHGASIIVLAALYNALKVVGKNLTDARIIINGAGAASIAVVKLLIQAGAKNITVCDTKGAIYKGRKTGMNFIKNELAETTNPEKHKGNRSRPASY